MIIQISALQSDRRLPEIIELSLDQDGLQFLRKQIETLERGQTDHFHLMSAEWGGRELALGPDGVPVHHLKVMLRQDAE